MNARYHSIKIKKLGRNNNKLPNLNVSNSKTDRSSELISQKTSITHFKSVEKRMSELKVTCRSGGPLSTLEISKYLKHLITI